MLRWIALPFVVIFAAALSAQEELPKDPEQPMDIEPPLLIQETPNQNIVYNTPATTEPNPAADIDQLTASLEKARKSAASGDRLYKAGIIGTLECGAGGCETVQLEAG